MIKILDQGDIKSAVGLLNSFYEESPYSNFTFDEDKVDTVLTNLILSEGSIVLGYIEDEILVGILVGTTTELIFSKEKLATELAWYVYPEYRSGLTGIKLFKAFEYWAKEVMKTKGITMMHLNNEKLDKLYTKNGYKKQEESYIKEF